MAVNVFATDSEREVELVKAKALAVGATAAVESNHWALGGKGAVALGRAVAESCGKMRAAGSPFKFLYPLELSIAEKFETICSTCGDDESAAAVSAASYRLTASFVGSTCASQSKSTARAASSSVSRPRRSWRSTRREATATCPCAVPRRT